jgi:hypothetical protein
MDNKNFVSLIPKAFAPYAFKGALIGLGVIGAYEMGQDLQKRSDAATIASVEAKNLSDIEHVTDRVMAKISSDDVARAGMISTPLASKGCWQALSYSDSQKPVMALSLDNKPVQLAFCSKSGVFASVQKALTQPATHGDILFPSMPPAAAQFEDRFFQENMRGFTACTAAEKMADQTRKAILGANMVSESASCVIR